MKLILVSCVKDKHTSPMPAKDLYRSDWFRKARRYAESQACEWRILSAEYGLLHPDTVIEPYERSLLNYVLRERAAWGARVIGQLEQLPSPDEIIFLAGLLYREQLIGWAGNRARNPLARMGIGQQKQWLAANGGFQPGAPGSC